MIELVTGDKDHDKSDDFEPAAEGRRALLVLSELRLVREGIAGVFQSHPAFTVAGLCETLPKALSVLQFHPGATVLIDGSFPNGLPAVRSLRDADPSACVIVFGLSETEDNIIAWVREGVSGYIPTTAGLGELGRFIECVNRGEQILSAAVASRLMRRLSAPPPVAPNRSLSRIAVSLTAREQEIIRMLAEGLCNKEIARRLRIELSTTKTHVHNLLGKLGLQRRSQVAIWAHRQGSEN